MNIINKIYQDAEPNLSTLGWLGIFGYPIYYVIWSSIFHQPYENMELRCFGSFLCLILVLRNFIPEKLKRFLPYLYIFTVTFCLPYFFSFMMFMNHWSTIWVMSFITSIFLNIILIHNAKVLLLQSVTSYIISYATVYCISSYNNLSLINWSYIPIILFIYIFGNIFYYLHKKSHEGKVSIAKSLGAGIAHEMRNPLSAIHTSFDLLKSLLPDDNAENRTISPKDLKTIHQLLRGVNDVLSSADETIDLILTSIDQHRVSTSTFRQHAVLDVIQKTLSSFSYRCQGDRNSISLDQSFNFDFFGNDTLLKYALYNLLKNAFYYRKSNEFNIHIKTIRHEKWNQIIFEDNGEGIEPKQIENIFKDFYTHGKNGGFGLGLPFCRRIMNSFGGSIQCESQLGKWTRFTLSFPAYTSYPVTLMKQEILKMKSILYIRHDSTKSSDAPVIQLLDREELNLREIDLDDALNKKDYEFEYDIIFINLEQADKMQHKFTDLEKILAFSSAQICCLFSQKQQQLIQTKRDLSIFPLKIEQLTTTSLKKTIEQILFGTKPLMQDKKPPQQVSPETEGKHILVVDDNRSVRTFTALLLEKQGYTVLQANDGTEALTSIDNQKIDLILMDIEMPVMDGIEAAKHIRSSNKPYRHIPIIGHTGDSQAKTLEKIKASGMNDYMIKPVRKEQLLGKVACLI